MKSVKDLLKAYWEMRYYDDRIDSNELLCMIIRDLEKLDKELSEENR